VVVHKGSRSLKKRERGKTESMNFWLALTDV